MTRFLSQQVLVVPFLLGASSITTLLVYFYGVLAMVQSVRLILLPAVVLLVFYALWARQSGRTDLYNRLLAGLWAGALATLAYDLVRVPLVWSGIPVFKAISYFGTVILGQSSPNAASEFVGWAYHLSNGIGFALMYCAIFRTPRLWTAVLWSLFLEGAMLLTPYAEVFGYRMTPAFLTVTISSHIIYGLTLWAMLKRWQHAREPRTTNRRGSLRLAFTLCLAPVGLSVIALDFHMRYGHALPQSPPSYIGRHLYTTWNLLEPDRISALWMMKRFVDTRAHFQFVPPFTAITHGTPFDIPEAELRRSATRSATEELLAQRGLEKNHRLELLARMTHLFEITPWMRPTDPQSLQLGQHLLAATGRCKPADVKPCLNHAFGFLDAWYSTAPSASQD